MFTDYNSRGHVRKANTLAGDREYREKKEINGITILIPYIPKKSDSRYKKLKKHNLLCKRAGIGPAIGHLKSDYRLDRNFYKGEIGDVVKVLLTAIAYNFKRAINALFVFIKKNSEILFDNNISLKSSY